MTNSVNKGASLLRILELVRSAPHGLLQAAWSIFSSHRRRLAAMLCLMFVVTTTAPPMAFCRQLERKIPAPAMPPHGVRKGPRTVKIITPRVSFSAKATDGELAGACIFTEPLAPMPGESSAGENQALANALTTYKMQKDRDDVSVLTRFLTNYPKSRWRPSLELHIAERRYESGYLSEAMGYWQSIWEETKNENKPALKGIADQALSQLLLVYVRLGRTKEFESLLSQIEKRPVYGSVEHSVKQARDALIVQKQHPEQSFKCGPYAVNSILNIGRTTPAPNAIVDKCHSTSNGTNLVEVKNLANKVGLHYQVAKRSPGADVVVPSVMHWKVGHFAAIVARHGNKYRVTDPTFDEKDNMWVTANVLDSETDGYSLIPNAALTTGWSNVSEQEAATIWGKGRTGGCAGGLPPSVPKDGGGTGGKRGGGGGGPCPVQPGKEHPHNCDSCGMSTAAGFALQATLNIEDTPLSYGPPVGPGIDFHLNYNYLEGMQPSSFKFSNLGQDWSFNWVSYLTLDSSQNATVRVRGGGYELYQYLIPDNPTNPYPPDLTSQAVLTIVSPGVYQRQLPDGSIEVFKQNDGAGRIFMTQVIDPQGNSASVQYEQLVQPLGATYWRVSTITDMIGQVSIVSYASNSPTTSLCALITGVTDPFGRSTIFAYDSTNSFLLSITDPINIKSQFAYVSSSSFINQLTTPYGTTSFVQGTFDAGGDTQTFLRFDYPDGSAEVIRNSFGNGTAPDRSYYWDREAMMLYPFDYLLGLPTTATRQSVWLTSVAYILQPVRNSLIFPIASTSTTSFTYAGQGKTADGDHVTPGPSNKPASITRGISSPTDTQVFAYEYNSLGNVTKSVQPNPLVAGASGRTMTYRYAPNNIDLLEVRGPNNDLLGKSIYNNNQHLPNSTTDGSGKTTQYVYNSFGQPTTITDPLGNITSNIYNADGFLVQTDGPLPGNSDVSTMTYDGYNRLYSTTNSEGYTVYLSYDNADRVTQITYPDLTTEQTIYNNLDAVMTKDRIGRWTQYSFDSMDRMSFMIDPLGRKTQYKWCLCGALTAVTDPNGNTTSFQYDLQDHLVSKTYPDGSQVTYAYDAIDRLITRTDALQSIAGGPGQQTMYSYNYDNTMSSVSYSSNTANNTPTVLYRWDSNYTRPIEIKTVDPISGSPTSDLVYTYNPYISNPFAAINVWIGGQPNTGDVVNVTVTISGVRHNVQYTVLSSDTTLAILAASIKSAINTALSSLNVNASSNGSLISINAPSGSTGTESANGPTTETVAGTGTSGDAVSITVSDAGLMSGPITIAHSVVGTDSPMSIAAALTTAINGNSALSGIGVTATSTGAVVTITSTSANATTYAGSVTSGTTGSLATETIVQALGPSENATAGGGGILQSSTNETISSSTATVTYSYDALGRTTNRWINGNANPVMWNYDPMSRLTSESNNLGTFGFNYLDNIPGASKGTAMLSSINYPNGQTTGFNYLPVAQDQRLQGITNFDPIGRVRSQFNYAYDSSGQISRWAQQNADMTPVTYGYHYDQAGQLSSARAGFGGADASSAAQNYYHYDSAANRTAAQSSTIHTAAIAGSITASDILKITVTDPGLPNGQETVPYTVQPGDTFSTIATNFAAQISADPNLQAIAINATGAANVISIKSNSGNGTSYSLTSSGITEKVMFGTSTNAFQNVVVGLVGTAYAPRIGDMVSVTVFDAGLSGGIEAVPAYPVMSGDTPSSIAAGLVTNINGDSNLGPIGVTASSSGNVVSIKSSSSHVTTYAGAVSPSTSKGTETITLGANNVGSITVTVNGTVTAGDVASITVRSLGLPGGQETIAYPAISGNTTSDIAHNLKVAITGDTNLSNIGVSASQTSNIITITCATPTYTSSSTGSGSESISFGTNIGGNVSATVGGTATAGDTLTIKSFNAALPSGAKSVTYTVVSGDTVSSIATNLSAKLNADSDLQKATINATATAAVIGLKYTPINYPAYLASTTGGGTETLTLTMSSNGSDNFVIAGTVTAADTVSFTTYDAGLPGGQKTDTYTVQSGDTLSAIATGVKNAVNSDSDLVAIRVTASINMTNPTVVVLNSNSTNATSYIPFTGSGASELIYPGHPNGTTTNRLNGTQTAVLSGSLTNGDTVSLTVSDIGLTGGPITKTHTVNTGTDTALASIASDLVSQINGDSSLTGIGVSATSVISQPSTLATSTVVINIRSTSANPTTYSESTKSGATEGFTLTSIGVQRSVHNHLNELVGQSAGGAIRLRADTNKPVRSANVNSPTLNIAWNNLYTTTFTPGPTTDIPATQWSASSFINGCVARLVSCAVGHPVTITTANSALPGGSITVTYTPTSTNTATAVTNLTSLINASTTLQSIGISATNGGGDTITIVVSNPTYSATTTGSSTETVTFGPNFNGTTTATVGGTVTALDTITVTCSFPGLSGSSHGVTIPVHSTDTLSTLAAALSTAINGDSAFEAIALSSPTDATTLNWAKNFTGNPTLTAGTNPVSASATDGGGSTTTNSYQFGATTTLYTQSTNPGATETIAIVNDNSGNASATIAGTVTVGDTLTIWACGPVFSQAAQSASYTVQSGDNLTNIAAGLVSAIGTKLSPFGINSTSSSAVINITGNDCLKTFTYDQNGNMLSDGVNTYQWDVENRLITINYPGSGNNSRFTYDGLGNRVKIVETTSGTISSTKQFIFAQGGMCEARDSGGTSVLNQYLKYGETISGSSYFFSYDHLGSVRELSDAFGAVQTTLAYEPYGLATKIVENVVSDFTYGGYYSHDRSGLYLTMRRAYNASLGRWLSRDRLPSQGNLYDYAGDSPTNATDPSGLRPTESSGAADIQGALKTMDDMCDCGACFNGPTDQNIADCHSEAKKIQEGLAAAWKTYNGAVWNNIGVLVGGKKCYQWQETYLDKLSLIGNLHIWSYSKWEAEASKNEDTGDYPVHDAVKIFIQNAPYASYCRIYADDGFYNSHIINIVPPKPERYEITYP
jgi:RHS repeat-associated protein